MGLKKTVIFLLCFLMPVCLLPAKVFAADAIVIFGSDSYEHASGEEFPVGVYIDGDSELGTYRIDVEYDADRLEYIGGGTSGGDGTVIIEGTGDSQQESTMLQFRALSGGETTLKIVAAQARESGSGESFNMTELAEVPLVLTGEDVVAARQTQSSSETTTQTEPSEESSGVKEDTTVPTEGNSSIPIAIGIVVALAAVLGAILTVIGVRKSKRKKAEKFKRAKNASKAIQKQSQDVRLETVSPNNEIKANKTIEKRVNLPEEAIVSKGLPKVFVKQPVFDLKKYTLTRKDNDSLTGSLKRHIISNEPVIQVKNVGMTFKVSNGNVSGLKDYMIQKAKGKLKAKRLNALDDISFTVYKGEVVGIIGTNGSGKSTLLKIVSGALNPTRGQVIADKNKIQLLTLGTGFDGELSARENVYLNGAIIGYSKEFIDAHYNEIVEFAELENFMEEKVKNFSSGMVSRLAFSIATVGTVAEILILDEVLSVGDQFFRKKSMERIEKMIHGGSTVLIVSHSLATIRQHCTKAVWIEKGILKQVGDPKEVCAAYSKMHEAKAAKSS